MDVNILDLAVLVVCVANFIMLVLPQSKDKAPILEYPRFAPKEPRKMRIVAVSDAKAYQDELTEKQKS